jgi:AcrR family transcriptional regulator
MPTRTPATRRRRRPEEARRAILDAAERGLSAAGPAGIRLAEVAARVGVSHPAILHHFGSREALVGAVVRRAMRALEEDLVAALRAENVERPSGADLIERVFEMLGPRGHARLLAWLLLSGHEPDDAQAFESKVVEIARAAHARRLRQLPRRAKKPAFEDTLFSILLVGVAMFGEAICGPQLRRRAGLGDDRDAARRFRKWLAELIGEHLEPKASRRAD